MGARPVLALFAVALLCASVAAQPQSSDLVGRWKVDIAFDNQVRRSLQFDAEASGKGSFLLEGTRSNWDEPARPFDAKWTQAPEKRVTFSGGIEFPIGNVGREPGTLVFKGVFQSERAIVGDVEFFLPGEDPFDANVAPSKKGTFKAQRIAR
jgi:hypothetical protein